MSACVIRRLLITHHALLITKKLAGAEGFEPTNAGSKDRCLTTWRRPNKSAGILPAGVSESPTVREGSNHQRALAYARASDRSGIAASYSLRPTVLQGKTRQPVSSSIA